MALAVLVATAVVAANVAFGGRSADSVDLRRNLDSFASIMAWDDASGWTVVDGESTGTVGLQLDDGRRVVITAGTPGEVSCGEREIPAACILLADMLGPGVVWFSIVPANDTTSRAADLPTLVDMVDDGARGVLANDWVVPLTNGVVRTCAGDETTRTLRQFIERYAQRGIRTVLDLDIDEIVEVVCAPAAQ